MPKLTKNQIEQLAGDVDEIVMGDNVYELMPDTVRPTHLNFSKPTKYDYPTVLDEITGKARPMSQDEKQALRRKSRKNAERLAKGLPLNPNQNRVKKSEQERKNDRVNRRNLRNDAKYTAYEELTALPKYAGMTAEEVYLSIRDNLKNGK